MEILTIILIAIGLSFDSFAVSVSCGIYDRHLRFKNAFYIAFWLALFQGVMPLIGWLAGRPFRETLSNIDHWIAFGLLSIIGFKMIIEAIKKTEQTPIKKLSFLIIISMAVATSLDALAVGFSFALTNTPVIIASIIIAFITGIASMLGMLFGKNLPAKKLKLIEFIGGLVLILIGSKILFEHMQP